MTLSLSSLALTAASLLIIRYLYRWLADPLRDVPGPFLARFTRLWELSMLLRGNCHNDNIDLHKKYGPIVRLAPGKYSVHDNASLRQIYGPGATTYKTAFYVPFGDPFGVDIFSERSNANHAASKRKISTMYSMSSLVSYEPAINEICRQFLARMTNFAKEQTSFDLFTWTQFYAIDVIGKITFDQSWDFIDAGIDKGGILGAVWTGNSIYSPRVGMLPEWHWPAFWPSVLVPWNPIWNSHWVIFQRFLEPVLKLAESPPDESSPHSLRGQDFLRKCQALIKAGKMTQSDLSNVLGQNVGAGSDTTGIGLASIIYFLMQNPDSLQKLRTEIDTAARDGRLTETIAFADGQSMPYLQAVIKEALRCHPAVGLILPRHVPDGGMEIAGKHIPAGTVVGTNAWVVHYDPQVWGDDAHLFRPERWLVSKEEVAILDKHFLAFGMGARTCIGRHVSLLEMTKLLVPLFHKFEFEAVHPGKWKTIGSWFVKPEYEVRVRVRQSIPMAI